VLQQIAGSDALALAPGDVMEDSAFALGAASRTDRRERRGCLIRLFDFLACRRRKDTRPICSRFYGVCRHITMSQIRQALPSNP